MIVFSFERLNPIIHIYLHIFTLLEIRDNSTPPYIRRAWPRKAAGGEDNCCLLLAHTDPASSPLADPKAIGPGAHSLLNADTLDSPTSTDSSSV